VLVATVPSRPALGSLATVARQHPGDAARIMVGRTLPLRPEYMFETLSGPEVDEHVDRCGPESPWAQFQLLLHRRPARPRNGAPVLVLASRADRLVPLADVRATARRYDAELHEFGGIGHNLMQDVGWEAPWATVAGWLDRVVPPVEVGTA
jgi:pimeloyl-ACP methyl ester carboxylesterase